MEHLPRTPGRDPALIQRQLTQRFGTLPSRVVQRVRSGALPEIERWSMRLLTAASLDDVFADDE